MACNEGMYDAVRPRYSYRGWGYTLLYIRRGVYTVHTAVRTILHVRYIRLRVSTSGI